MAGARTSDAQHPPGQGGGDIAPIGRVGVQVGRCRKTFGRGVCAAASIAAAAGGLALELGFRGRAPENIVDRVAKSDADVAAGAIADVQHASGGKERAVAEPLASLQEGVAMPRRRAGKADFDQHLVRAKIGLQTAP